MHLSEETMGLNYYEQGSGPVLVLLHGLGLDHSIWLPLARNCSSDMRMIMPDLRGHGLSDSPDGIFTMGDMAADIKQLLDRLSVEKIVLTGHSMGGYVALAFVRIYPDLVDGLILVTTNADEDPPEKRTSRILLAKEIGQKGSIAMADSLANRLTNDPTLALKMHAMISKTTPNGLIGASLGMAERKDMHQTLRSLTCPVLVIAGERDKITPLSTSQDLVNTCQSGELVIVPNTGHLPMMEEPDLMSKAFFTFLKEKNLLGCQY